MDRPTAEPRIGDDAPVSTRPRIRALAPLLVNQIAAGEVIERPASVVKELVENSIDAGATRIAVDLERGGIELIRVTDDGAGIEPDQLPLALAPHATSKISRATDLDRIATKGFRGEALASICSVARLSITSRPAGADAGARIDAEGDDIKPARPASSSPGTTIEVRNLFFNTPARRKFLRTPQTEQTRCLDWVRDLAMAHPAIAFTAAADGRRVLDLPPGQTPRERVLDLLGGELDDQLVEVTWDQFDDARGVSIWGLAGLPTLARATPRAQHVFLSGRALRDRTVQHALREAYRGLIEPGRHPTAVLMIEMSPEGVDVNVHPAKLEVRFRDQSMVHQAVLHAVRDALRARDLTPSAVDRRPDLAASGAQSPTQILPAREGDASGGGVGGPDLVDPARFAELFKRRMPGRDDERLDFTPRDTDTDRAHEPEHREPGGPSPGYAAPPEPSPRPDDDAPAHGSPIRKAMRVLQVHRSYLVAEDEHGIVLIDQHALHERVMFEKLLARVTGGDDPGGSKLETQRLLSPVAVPAAPASVERLDELAPLLERLGIDAAPLGPATIAVHAFPSFLFSRGVDPCDFMTDLLERVERDDFTPGSEAALHEALDMMACKAAVKAGDALSEDELAELLSMRERVERSGSCPHGRATTVRLTIEDLERLFDRR